MQTTEPEHAFQFCKGIFSMVVLLLPPNVHVHGTSRTVIPLISGVVHKFS